MTGPVPAAALAREYLEALLLPLTEAECSCEGEVICSACAAIEALEQLGRAEFVAGLLPSNRKGPSMYGTENARQERRVKNAGQYHDEAMDWAERGDFAKRVGDTSTAARCYHDAFVYEKTAAEIVAPYLDLEPTRSVLHRSAATLASQCGELAEAARLIEAGLAGNPPAEIAEELRELRDSLGAIAKGDS